MRWLIVWLIQFAAMFFISGALSLSLWAGQWVYRLCLWCILPLVGAVSAYLATVNGLLNYAAWIAPPAALAVSHMLLWYYLPDSAIFFLSALISIVGAAAGEVMVRTKKSKH